MLQEPEHERLFKGYLGNNRYLTVGTYKQAITINIRQYVYDGNGHNYPTRKGVSFSARRWASFVQQLKDADREVDTLKWRETVDFRRHIGGGYYIVVKDFDFVNIRRYSLGPNSSKGMPTRFGIALRLEEWDRLLTTIGQMHQLLPEVKNAKPCHASEDDRDKDEYRSCTECNPFAH